MGYKLVGGTLIIVSCAGFGFSIASAFRREIRILRQIVDMTLYMENELSYRMTPLPELCRKVGKRTGGVVRDVLTLLAEEMERQSFPDAPSCMHHILSVHTTLPRSAERIFARFGTSLGEYDLSGQLKGLEAIRDSCLSTLLKLEQNRENRLRSYQTLGLCAGVAIVILFI